MSSPPRSTLARSAVLGGVSGLRTFTGLAALTLRTGRADRQPEAALGTPWAKGGVSLLAAWELIMDKLPKTPDRRRPIAALGRVAAGSLCGLLVCRSSARSADAPTGPVIDWAPAVGAGAAAAVATTLLGPLWRAALGKRLGVDAAGATAEDLVAIVSAWLAARPPEHDALEPEPLARFAA